VKTAYQVHQVARVSLAESTVKAASPTARALAVFDAAIGPVLALELVDLAGRGN